MSVQSLAPSLPALRWPELRVAGLALLVGLGVLGLLFRAEAAAAVQVWYDSTAYSHCFFVLPIALYLAWDRRHGAAGLAVRPMPWAGLLALPLAAVWLLAERLGIMEGRQLVAITFVELLFLTVLGWRLFWAFSAALLYLYFLVPFGAFLTPALQQFTADFSLIGLRLIGIPFYADEFLIEIPEGRFYVAEACAGLRFLIASIAFGVLYACLIYRSYARRAAFIVASIIIPIIANGFRALGIVVLGHYLGSAEAAAADHILYGWVFFSIVILLLILAGMPFRQDHDPLPPRAPDPGVGRPNPLRVGLAAGVVLFFAGTSAGAAAWLDSRATPVAAVAAPQIVNSLGCRATGPATVEPPTALGQRSVQDFKCGPVKLTLTMQVFPARASLSQIVGMRRSLGQENAPGEVEFGSLTIPDGTPRTWRLAIANDPAAMGATALWVEGAPSRGGLAERLTQARNSLVGASAAPVLVAISLTFPTSPLTHSDRERARAGLTEFLAGQTTLSDQIAAIAAAAVRPAGG